MEISQEMSLKAINYKKNVAGKFMLIEGAKIKSRMTGEDFCVTRKIDGHLQTLFYNDGEVAMLNSNGVQKASDLKCLKMFAGFMSKSGLKSAIFAAELYLPRAEGRPRCGDVVSALADETKRDELALAFFDIIEVDGQPFASEHYKEVHDRLKQIFILKAKNDKGLVITKSSSICGPVEMRAAASLDEVKQIYDEWVEGEGAEGLVVHNETNIISKIKPRHTIDAAVIGYTTSDRGVRDLMMAVMHEDGAYQMFALGSTGISDEDRQTLASRLADNHVESQYVLSDSRGIAYQMVQPKIVYEISFLELVARGNDDKVKTNPLLRYSDEQGWILEGMVPGVSVLGISFNMERTDKTPSPSDVRVSQLTDICPFEEPECPISNLEKSSLLERRVFKKVAKNKEMLHKFLLWKTNKEASGRYPAYVFYHTDYSSSRKEMIKRDMAFSNSEEQVRQIMEAEIADNIKKGWEEI
ncbi:MAG: hypothetical protein II308_02820 [Muribaculaceae bacterium]|nr:hypothetical protein [Muribaculaceae bacterium]MBQ2398985.1 hypothetical protein [Muribaculaceae bacterium]MBQ5724153.1 hypothetical protein [Muribaculaceae bacterium]